MIYLKNFSFPSQDSESGYFSTLGYNYYTSYYPFQFFPAKGMSGVEFSDITIFCGSNGSGKSTTLNVIGEKLGLQRSSKFNTTELFADYVGMTHMELWVFEREKLRDLYAVSRIITSDDVFNHILDVRDRNDEKDFRRDVIKRQRSEYMCDPMSRPFAKIYDMDSNPARVVQWTELPSVRIYHDFFERHAGEFSG